MDGHSTLQERVETMYRLGLLLPSLCAPCAVLGAEVFVSSTGSDNGIGSKNRPFRTIQHGVNALGLGDTCYVREGVYREDVTFGKSGADGKPARLRAFPGERVVLDGTEPISGPWTNESDGVFSMPTSMKIEQLFAGECMLTEARWPNCPSDKIFTRDGWAAAGPKSAYGTIHSPELGKTGIDWNVQGGPRWRRPRSGLIPGGPPWLLR